MNEAPPRHRQRGRVLVVGDVMTDIIVKPEGPIVHGSDRRAAISMRPGGSGANQAVWLGAMGVDVQFIARVGAADRGRFSQYFSSFGVEARLGADESLPSGTLIALVSPDGERSFLTDRGANMALCEADLPVSLLDGKQLLLVSGYTFFAKGPRTAVMALFAAARQRQVPIAVDPASLGFLREAGSDNFFRWTEGASMILANESEAEVLSGSSELDVQMQALGGHYDRAIIKRGSKGAAMGGRAGIALDLPAPLVTAVDTTGAGDAFAAAFLASELEGREAQACLEAGIAAGTAAVQLVGAQPILP
jgi:sugar/nucleoside kinase (ribokinase family)